MLHWSSVILLVFSLDITNCIQFKNSSQLRNESHSSAIISNIIAGIPSNRLPFYARVRFGQGRDEFCGAVIVREIFAMTAASCVGWFHREFDMCYNLI